MTDHEHPGPSDAQERAVRDLLAAARHDQPVPDEVVARLDATLADLVAQRAAVRSAPVVEIAARRRRRMLGAGLAAAAAVVVAGVGLGQLLPLQAGDDEASSAGSAREFGAQEDAGGDSADQEPAAAEERLLTGGSVALESTDSDRAIRRAVREASTLDTSSLRDAPGCPLPVAGTAARSVEVLWDGAPARAVYLPPRRPDRLEVYRCEPPLLVREVDLR